MLWCCCGQVSEPTWQLVSPSAVGISVQENIPPDPLPESHQPTPFYSGLSAIGRQTHSDGFQVEWGIVASWQAAQTAGPFGFEYDLPDSSVARVELVLSGATFVRSSPPPANDTVNVFAIKQQFPEEWSQPITYTVPVGIPDARLDVTEAALAAWSRTESTGGIYLVIAPHWPYPPAPPFPNRTRHAIDLIRNDTGEIIHPSAVKQDGTSHYAYLEVSKRI